jgi:hypothetical protein
MRRFENRGGFTGSYDSLVEKHLAKYKISDIKMYRRIVKMNKTIHIPFELRGILNTLEVNYKANDSANESGFDAILDIPFDPNLCTGYPVIHARIKDMKNTGNRRLCAWIQLVSREYYSAETLEKPDEIMLFVDNIDPSCIYTCFGFPAELYDAPCNLLNGNAKGRWTAFTYLVDIPSVMNGYKMSFLAGFQWGYYDALVNNKLVVNLQDIQEINSIKWREHIEFLKKEYPKYEYV